MMKIDRSPCSIFSLAPGKLHMQNIEVAEEENWKHSAVYVVQVLKPQEWCDPSGFS